MTDALVLPPGYERVPYDDMHWQIQGGRTPRESKQQGGSASVYFRPARETSTDRAFEDFDRWFMEHGYVHAGGSAYRPQCDEKLVAASWVNTTHVITLHYLSEPGRTSSVSIPYSYASIPALGSSQVEVIDDLPVCPA